MAYQLFDIELDVDEERMQERSGRILADREYGRKGLGARIACALESVHTTALEGDPSEYKRIAMRCIAHPHRECRISELTFSVNLLAETGDMSSKPQIKEMNPKSLDRATRETAISKKAATLKPSLVPIGSELSEEITKDSTQHFWIVKASGIGTARALWTFTAHDQVPLDVDHALEIFVNAGQCGTALKASFLIDAWIQRPGVLSSIPFLGKTEVCVPLNAPL